MKKNILAENMKRFGTKNLKEQGAPVDNVIKISGSEPYYTVIYKDGGEQVQIDFDDYEVMDRIDTYTSDMNVTGTDNKGQTWSVMAAAVAAGGGDYDWDFEWDTIEKA